MNTPIQKSSGFSCSYEESTESKVDLHKGMAKVALRSQPNEVTTNLRNLSNNKIGGINHRRRQILQGQGNNLFSRMNNIK